MPHPHLSLRQLLDELSQEEQLLCIWKRAGFSSKEIAEFQGRSTASIEAVFSRVRRKLRELLRERTEQRHNTSGSKRPKVHSTGPQQNARRKNRKTDEAD